MAKIAEYTIVMPQKATENERRAAAFIRENIRLVCGKKVPLVTDDAAPVPLEIVVGQTNREALTGFTVRRWREENRNGAWEYVVQKVGERLFLSSMSHPPEEGPYVSAYHTLNDGKIGTRHYMMGLHPKKENIYPVIDDILSTPLPMEIKV